jgi:glutamate-1-semialdehyde 2,1-aminomutase
MSDYASRLESAIPGGSHTYSKGSDQFPKNAPQILERGKGVLVYDPEGNEYLDFGMGLRSVLIGYAEDEVDRKAIEYIRRGMNLTRPSTIELQAAELMINLVDSAEMVKFAKNGSTVVTAAVKLARAFTGRSLVAICSDHPFFSFDDWFIGTTAMSKGIPTEYSKLTKSFKYNDIGSLEKLVTEHEGQIACVVLEPLAGDCPDLMGSTGLCCSQAKCARAQALESNFLQQVQDLCRKHGIVFILDEMITGFRWGNGGAQKAFGIDPDLSTFGKAIANGYPLACLVGKKEIMSQGSIQRVGQERLFLISTTHGADMASLGAFISNIEFLDNEQVVDHVWKFGAQLITLMKSLARQHNLSDYFDALGPACVPRFITRDAMKQNSLTFRTLFVQEMLKHKILMPWISIAYRHNQEHMNQIEYALNQTFKTYADALEQGPERFIEGSIIKPVFRKYN